MRARVAGSCAVVFSAHDIPAVSAGLLSVIVIGPIVENPISRAIERNTVHKWGTQS